MKTLIWNRRKLNFQNIVLDAWVACSPNNAVLEREWENLGPTLPIDTSLILRHPPVIVGEVIGHSPRGRPFYKTTCPDGELWKIRGLGSFDSIWFAKAVFNAPDDEYFLKGIASLQAIISALSEGFAEGDFKLHFVNGAYLVFDLITPNAKVTRKQYAILDKLIARFFTGGPHMRAALFCMPHSFVIGAIGII